MVQLDVLDGHRVSTTTISTDSLFTVDYAYVILMIKNHQNKGYFLMILCVRFSMLLKIIGKYNCKIESV